MNYLRLLFYLSIGSQSVLLAQTDSVKKKFKPYGLIDAAPVAISKEDFKPQIILTIQTVDAITKLPVDVTIDYYMFGDSVIKTESGKIISLAVNMYKKTVIVANAPGYIWQTQIIDSPDSDSSYFLNLIKIKKGDIIYKNFSNLNLQGNKWESNFYPDLMGIKEFLRLNPGVKIQISSSSEKKNTIESYFSENDGKKRVLFKGFQNQKKPNSGTITIKILRT